MKAKPKKKTKSIQRTDRPTNVQKKHSFRKRQKLPISYWSYSSLISYLRNPLAWYKRYVEKIYDTPSTPAGVVGRAGHIALQHYYGGIEAEGAIALGLEYLRNVADFEINFGKHSTRADKKKRRISMEREFLQAIGFYLEKPPRFEVVGVEMKGMVEVKGYPLPLKAVSDLVVVSKVEKGALDIVDHKFVDSFSKLGKDKSLFILQALFNYYTVRARYGKPVRRFIIVECKKSKNTNGKSQLKRYTFDFLKYPEEFKLLKRLITDATNDIAQRKLYLPNPSDLFEGEDSFMVYKLGLIDTKEETAETLTELKWQ